MRGIVLFGLFGVLAACSGKPEVPARGSAATVTPKDAGPRECSDLPFAPTTPIAEASGAAWLEVAGQPALVVISDSGHDGDYAIVDAESGATLEEGKLPLGTGASDDLEGIAVRGGKFHVISSPGWIRTYTRADHAFTLVDGPYPLGPVDLDDKGGGLGDQPPKGTGMVCAAKRTNCGRNYEGLCLAPEPADAHARCVGYAAAKADGHLYCVIEEAGRLVVRYAASIRIARPGVIADCAFAADGRLYVGSNLFDAGTVYRVDHWQDPAEATVREIAAMPIGFPETLAVTGDVFYRMSDTGGAPSMMRKLRCPN